MSRKSVLVIVVSLLAAAYSAASLVQPLTQPLPGVPTAQYGAAAGTAGADVAWEADMVWPVSTVTVP
jgi:hypothetical protein